MLKRFALIPMPLDEGVRHRAEQWDVEQCASEHGRGAGKTRQVTRARCQQFRFCAVRPAHAEINQQFVRCCQY